MQPYTLGCTIAIIMSKGDIKSLLWMAYCDFSYIFPKLREGNRI